MNVAFNEPHIFSEGELHILGLLADQAAVAIAQAQLIVELREALAARDMMIANVSHELRTPLTHIIGYCELFDLGTLGGELLPDQRHAIEVIHQQARRLTDLINALLRFQSLSPENLYWGEVNLQRLATAAVERWRERAAKAKVGLELRSAAEVPVIWGDMQRLGEVLNCLLDNALKFTPAGGTVSVWVEHREDGVWLSVSDTGIGIPPEHLERVFERFHQVNGGSTRRYGGMGVGLALVREIVSLHGGRVWAESNGVPGHGTTVHVVLPISPSPGD
jgi:signal transduction histidine kinase